MRLLGSDVQPPEIDMNSMMYAIKYSTGAKRHVLSIS